MRNILLVTTGGTIGALPYADPVNPPDHCVMPGGRDVVIEVVRRDFGDVLPRLRLLAGEACDSKSIAGDYLAEMLELFRQAPEQRIILTVGTDRIAEIAQAIRMAARTDRALADKHILLVGAMTPLLNGALSDGYQNLRHAFDLLGDGLTVQLPNVGIVLSAFDADRRWRPLLHDCDATTFRKRRGDDGRYYQLEPVAGDQPAG